MTIEVGLRPLIEAAFKERGLLERAAHLTAVRETIAALDCGELRVASPPDNPDDDWTTHAWIKEAILLYFAIQKMEKHEVGPFEFHDKIPLKHDLDKAGARVVPPGTVRYGAFLGAGSIIFMLHHEQNIWKMGGLAGRLGITFLTFIVGTLALIGCPPFSGFWSKDAILALAYEKNTAIFALALFTAFLTAFYMLRLVVVVFFGKPRSENASKGQESPWVMVIPLVLLAIPALLAGFSFTAHRFLTLPAEHHTTLLVPAFATAVMLLGSVVAIVLYRGRDEEPLNLAVFRRRFFIDEFYAWLISATQDLLARIAAFFDRWIIDVAGVRGASTGVWGIGSVLRLLQVGNLQAYSFLFGLGIVGLIYLTIFR